MPKLLKLVLQSLRDSNYLSAKCGIVQSEEFRCQYSLLKNGLKLREELLNQWTEMCCTRTTQYDTIQQIERNVIDKNNRISFLDCSEFQKSFRQIYKEKKVNLTNSIALKTICNNINDFVSKEKLFCDSETKTLLVTEFFVAAEIELSKYYNLQRERKIWWMRFSANPSRYSVDPFDLCLEGEVHDEVCKKSKSLTIKANFPFGLIDMESISLVPLYELQSLNLPFTEDFYKISVIRSVINLDLATSALILDASLCRTKYRNNTIMLNRKLAPYQVLLANLHQGNKIVDELTLHLQYVINKSGLRLYDNYIHTKTQIELETELMQFDSLGIPYSLVVDDESVKSGLIKLRCRDTTLFETIHISDIPNYLLNIFNH